MSPNECAAIMLMCGSGFWVRRLADFCRIWQRQQQSRDITYKISEEITHAFKWHPSEQLQLFKNQVSCTHSKCRVKFTIEKGDLSLSKWITNVLANLFYGGGTTSIRRPGHQQYSYNNKKTLLYHTTNLLFKFDYISRFYAFVVPFFIKIEIETYAIYIGSFFMRYSNQQK